MRTIASKQSPISATKEDYIRAIYMLQTAESGASVTQISERLKLSKSTVSERIKELVRDDLAVAESYAPVTLTQKGVDIGEKLTFKHRIIEVFLHDVLKIEKEKIHAEAERLEHACSDEVIQKLADFLDNPKNDPHGSAIPQIKNWN